MGIQTRKNSQENTENDSEEGEAVAAARPAHPGRVDKQGEEAEAQTARGSARPRGGIPGADVGASRRGRNWTHASHSTREQTPNTPIWEISEKSETIAY